MIKTHEKISKVLNISIPPPRWGRLGGGAGFTLMEIMVVIVVVGMIAVFTIPNISRSVERSHRTEMENNLRLIHGANKRYFVQQGVYWPFADTSIHLIADINNNLGLEIIEDGAEYFCVRDVFYPNDNIHGYVCGADRPDTAGRRYGLVLTQAELSTVNPACDPAAACP